MTERVVTYEACIEAAGNSVVELAVAVEVQKITQKGMMGRGDLEFQCSNRV